MPKVVVAGSANMDLVASADRIPVPGETILGTDLHYFPGGKGLNQAIAAARLGAQTQLIAKIGTDAFGKDLSKFLENESVDQTYVSQTTDAPTGCALIVVAESDNSIVVIPGANDRLGPPDFEDLTLSPGDIAVAQFEIPTETVRAFFIAAKNANATTLLNPAPMRSIPHELLDLTDILIVNETELAALGSDDPKTITAQPTDQMKHIRRRPDQVVVLTRGREGVLALVSDRTVQLPARKVPVVDTTGAGDCFVGALAASLARSDSLEDALGFANQAASICVGTMGAAVSMPRLEDLVRT